MKLDVHYSVVDTPGLFFTDKDGSQSKILISTVILEHPALHIVFFTVLYIFWRIPLIVTNLLWSPSIYLRLPEKEVNYN